MWIKESIIIFLLFVSVVLFLFGQVLFPPDGYALFADDMWRSYGFFRRYFVGSILSGQFPWWNPYVFSGMPYAANPSVAAFYPVNWKFFFMPFNAAYGWTFAIHIFIALWAMYWFSKKVLRLDTVSAIGASLAFGLSQYFLARTWAGHADTVAASALIPFVIGSFMLLFRTPTRKHILLAAVSLAFQILAGYQTVAMFTLEAVGILMLLQKSVKSFVVMSISLCLALLLSAFQLLPQAEFMGKSVRSTDFPYEWVSVGSLVPSSLQQLFSPFILGDQTTFVGPPPNYHEQAFFFSVTALFLAVYALIKKRTIGFALIALFALWISFGPNSPVDGNKILYELMPLYRHIRFPARHMVLSVFAVSCLAGTGFSLVRKSWLRGLFVCILFIELYIPAKHLIEIKPLPELTYDSTIRSLKNGRILPNYANWIQERNAFDFDAGIVYGVESATGYDPSMLSNYYDFIDASNGSETSSILSHNVQIPYVDMTSPYVNFLNVQYVLVPFAYDTLIGNSQYKLLYTSDTYGLRLYENSAVLPRFYIAGEAKTFSDRQEVAAAIRSRKYDPQTTLLVTDKTSNDCEDVSTSKIIQDRITLNSVRLTLNSPCNAYLATSEVMYPGWRAYIDGKRVPVITNNLAFRAVEVPGGEHVVEFTFVPESFLTGLAISLVTVCCLILLLRR